MMDKDFNIATVRRTFKKQTCTSLRNINIQVIQTSPIFIVKDFEELAIWLQLPQDLAVFITKYRLTNK